MGEPLLDLSEIIDLYKEDARRMVEKMRVNMEHWDQIQQGGPARADLRRLSHQLRGSGRTYGFRKVTRMCKAIENIVFRLEQGKLQADERVKNLICKTIEK